MIITIFVVILEHPHICYLLSTLSIVLRRFVNSRLVLIPPALFVNIDHVFCGFLAGTQPESKNIERWAATSLKRQGPTIGSEPESSEGGRILSTGNKVHSLEACRPIVFLSLSTGEKRRSWRQEEHIRTSDPYCISKITFPFFPWIVYSKYTLKHDGKLCVR